MNSSFYWVNRRLDHRTKSIRLPANKPSDRSSVRIAGGCGPMSTEVCLLSPPCFILHSVVSISYSPVNSVNIISINNITYFSSLQLLLDMLQCSVPSTLAQTTMLLTYSWGAQFESRPAKGILAFSCLSEVPKAKCRTSTSNYVTTTFPRHIPLHCLVSTNLLTQSEYQTVS